MRSTSCCARTVPASTSFPTTSRRMKKPPPNTAAAAASKPVKRRLAGYLAERRPAAITEAVWKELLELLAPVSEGYLRDMLRSSHLPFEQPWAGVRQQI